MAKDKADWEAIQAEWIAGQLDIREIARQHGLDESAIRKRAKRKNWPERQTVTESVRAIVRNSSREESERTISHAVALTAFDRAIKLLLRHRQMLGSLASQIAWCDQQIQAWQKALEERGRTPKLHEIDAVATIVAKCAQAASRLVPLERRAFGFTDADAPSEFDGLTESELAAVEDAVRKALGR